MSGNSLIPDNYAVLWERGTIRRLFPVGNGDQVNGINKRGQVVATLFGVDEGPFAYTWADGALTRLPLLPGAQYSFAEDINDAGWIVGASGTASGELHAVLWRDGTVIDLGLAPGGIDVATASAVNERGQIVGYGSAPTTVVPFLWERGQMIALDQPAGSTGTLPLGLNNRGHAVGAGNALAFPSTSHALLWGTLRHP
jgi:probable HAF family extracellular repeat protein